MFDRRQFIVVLLLATATIGATAPQSSGDVSPARAHEYAVYFSPGPEKGIPWGGYHVTVTGYSDAHAPGKSQKAILANAWNNIFHDKPQHLGKAKGDGKDGYTFSRKSAKDGWRVDFTNASLDKLEKYLQKHGFEKAGSTRHKPYWHISLYGKDKQDAVQKFNHLAQKGWRLWLVPRDGPWEAIGSNTRHAAVVGGE
jgi:hypothetical protein